jgi:hypothetical protein
LDKAADPPVLEEIVRNRMGGIKWIEPQYYL